MRTSFLGLCTALLFVACAGRAKIPDPEQAPAASPQRWQETSAEEGFSFSMPGVPRVERETTPTAAGPLPVVMYIHETETAAFNVTSARFPEGFMEARAAGEILAGARDGAVGNISGELLEQRDAQLFGPDGEVSPGLEIVIQTPAKLLYRGRIFITGRQLIQLSYVSGATGGSETEYRHFIESFILTAQ